MIIQIVHKQTSFAWIISSLGYQIKYLFILLCIWTNVSSNNFNFYYVNLLQNATFHFISDLLQMKGLFENNLFDLCRKWRINRSGGIIIFAI